MTDATPRRIEFRLEGSRKDEGLIRAQDFVGFLENALSILRRLERAQTGEARRTSVEYRIVDLEIGSAVIALEAVAPEELDVGLLFGRFAKGVAAFRDGRFDKLEYDPATVEAFSEMMAPLRRGVRSISVALDGTEIEVSSDRVETFAFTPEDEVDLVGAVSGYIDAINVHKELVFYLYPTVGGPRVSCTFDRTMLDHVRGALKRYTTVHGLVSYLDGNPFPSHVVVDRVEINPPPTELPTLRDLWAIAPGLTGGLDSVAYIRHVRDADE